MAAHARSDERLHLASLIDDWEVHRRERAVVAHIGVRAFGTTYGELGILTGRFAAELRRRQIAPGERVLLWGANSAEWIAAFFGCVLCGVIVVPLDAAGSSGFAQRVLSDVTPRLVIGDPALLSHLHGNEPQLATTEFAGALPISPDLRVDSSVNLDSPLQIVFTSGTTSDPKGVVHTHRNVLASVAPIELEMARYRRYERLVHPLRFLHTLPLSHVFGQFMGLWLPPLLGAEVHFIDGVEAGRLITTTKRERISVLVAVPRILDLLRTHLQQNWGNLQAQLDRSRGIPAWMRWWRFRRVHRLLGFKFWALICGGATLPDDLEAFWNGLGLALIQGYGMTETAALVTLNHPFKVGKGTLGKALPGREVRLSPEGEIEVRGDMLAAGMWRNGSFQPRAGEWLATGDLGAQEPSGELRFAGRKGDVIVTAAGMNVYPGDLEAALRVQPRVREAAVVACHLPHGTEPVAAVLFEGDDEQLRATMAAANAQLAPHQQLRYVLRWPEPQLPFTPTGKLLRRRVAAWACEHLQPTGQASASSDPLLRLLSRITLEPLTSTSASGRLTEDLHLDSLGRVQLQSALQAEFGVDLGDDQMAAITTLAELRAALGWNSPPANVPASTFGQDSISMVAAAHPITSRPEPALYPKWPWSRPAQWLRAAFVELAMRPLVRLIARPRILRTIPAPLPTPMLIVANHVNMYDVPLVLYALPGVLRRHVAVAMSAEVLGDMLHGRAQGSWWRNLLARPAGWLLVALFNVFPLPRLRGFRRSFAHAGEALDRGYSVLIFPEGRRGTTGELQPFRPGIGLLVGAARVNVLPVALQGMGTQARAGKTSLRAGNISVHIGTPISFAPETSPEEITHQLEAALRALRPS